MVKFLGLKYLRDRKTTARDLMDEWNTSLPENDQVSRSTVFQRLCENGLHGRVAVKKPLLSKANVRKYFRFAKTHKDWTVDQWMKVLWTDSKFEVFGSKRRQYVRRRSMRDIILCALFQQ